MIVLRYIVSADPPPPGPGDPAPFSPERFESIELRPDVTLAPNLLCTVLSSLLTLSNRCFDSSSSRRRSDFCFSASRTCCSDASSVDRRSDTADRISSTSASAFSSTASSSSRRLRHSRSLRSSSSFSLDSVLMSRSRSRIFCFSSSVSRVLRRASVLDSSSMRSRSSMAASMRARISRTLLSARSSTSASRPRILSASRDRSDRTGLLELDGQLARLVAHAAEQTLRVGVLLRLEVRLLLQRLLLLLELLHLLLKLLDSGPQLVGLLLHLLQLPSRLLLLGADLHLFGLGATQITSGNPLRVFQTETVVRLVRQLLAERLDLRLAIRGQPLDPGDVSLEVLLLLLQVAEFRVLRGQLLLGRLESDRVLTQTLHLGLGLLEHLAQFREVLESGLGQLLSSTQIRLQGRRLALEVFVLALQVVEFALQLLARLGVVCRGPELLLELLDARLQGLLLGLKVLDLLLGHHVLLANLGDFVAQRLNLLAEIFLGLALLRQPLNLRVFCCDFLLQARNLRFQGLRIGLLGFVGRWGSVGTGGRRGCSSSCSGTGLLLLLVLLGVLACAGCGGVRRPWGRRGGWRGLAGLLGSDSLLGACLLPVCTSIRFVELRLHGFSLLLGGFEFTLELSFHFLELFLRGLQTLRERLDFIVPRFKLRLKGSLHSSHITEFAGLLCRLLKLFSEVGAGVLGRGEIGLERVDLGLELLNLLLLGSHVGLVLGSLLIVGEEVASRLLRLLARRLLRLLLGREDAEGLLQRRLGSGRVGRLDRAVVLGAGRGIDLLLGLFRLLASSRGGGLRRPELLDLLLELLHVLLGRFKLLLEIVLFERDPLVFVHDHLLLLLQRVEVFHQRLGLADRPDARVFLEHPFEGLNRRGTAVGDSIGSEELCNPLAPRLLTGINRRRDTHQGTSSPASPTCEASCGPRERALPRQLRGTRSALGLLVLLILPVLALLGLLLHLLVTLVHGVGCRLGRSRAAGLLAVVERKGRFKNGRVGVRGAAAVVVLGYVSCRACLLGARSSRGRLIVVPRGGIGSARRAACRFYPLSCLLLSSLFLRNCPIDGALEPLLETHHRSLATTEMQDDEKRCV
ncbi:uncharacterized protein ColSpa_06080 [Colletotrichum spaethianum]|uniref:Uncharacterized protein n=1 Tax=Colletotrichum spaethianum TaxID=700344 RepID=A0AA37LG24_9PEZI|nr:uncharacterized protein ColSpa_06080 [Colletotrichum spaethianum]GKT45900.1 hypothetical protein ColSpa_06080 [Colletotrichum spaethianum]